MRSLRHTIKCHDCPAHVTLEIQGVGFSTRAQEYVERVAELEGWVGGRCPVHVDATNKQETK